MSRGIGEKKREEERPISEAEKDGVLSFNANKRVG